MIFSESRDKKKRNQKQDLEKALKLLEKNFHIKENLCLYNNLKELEEIYDNTEEALHIGSRCQWHEEGEKSAKFLLVFEKFHGVQSQICKVIADGTESVDYSEIHK